MLKQKDLLQCNREIVGRKVANAKGKVNNMVDKVLRYTFNLLPNIGRNVDQSLLAVDSRPRELVDREAKTLQQNVHTALRNAASGVQGLFVSVASAPELVDRCQGLTVGHLQRDELAKPGSSSAHSANFEPRRSQPRAESTNEIVPKGVTS